MKPLAVKHDDTIIAEGKILELQSLDNFLISVERRAFRMAMVSLVNHDDALDAVQDAMTQLVAKYRDKSWEEWRPLFYRILHNKIMDVHRKRKLQQLFNGWLGGYKDPDDDGPEDPIMNAPGPDYLAPENKQHTAEQLKQLERALHDLPLRQQQAFMLRCWEGLSTIETAQVMKCSEGSVKTHYSRAMHSLRGKLGDNHE